MMMMITWVLDGQDILAMLDTSIFGRPMETSITTEVKARAIRPGQTGSICLLTAMSTKQAKQSQPEDDDDDDQFAPVPINAVLIYHALARSLRQLCIHYLIVEHQVNVIN